MNQQHGFGLAELLMALMLSSFMIVLLSQQYLHTKKIYRSIQSKLDNLIDQAMIDDLIRDSARRYGFTPCLSIDHLDGIDRRFENRPLSALKIGKEKDAPYLSFYRMSERFNEVLEFIDSKTLLTTSFERLYPKQSILIADCYHAEVQTVNKVEGVNQAQRVTIEMPSAYLYQAPVYIGPWVEETYFIKKNTENQPSLFYRSGQAEELTTAIHTLTAMIEHTKGRSWLRVIFGLDEDQSMTLLIGLRAL